MDSATKPKWEVNFSCHKSPYSLGLSRFKGPVESLNPGQSRLFMEFLLIRIDSPPFLGLDLVGLKLRTVTIRATLIPNIPITT